ncbi:MAG: site-specific integrase, partial [Ignavibacteriaceae bacterium]
KSLRYLRSAFNWAITEKYLIENPCKDIKPIKIPEKQPLFFSETDFQILIKSIDGKDIRDIVIFAVNTGLRLRELTTLHWNQINLKDKYLILDNMNHTTKSKKIRTLALNNKALQILNEREFQNDKNVFTINNLRFNADLLSKKFKRYVISSGLNPKLKFHSLRHTFASWLVQRGVSIYEVSKLLGHSDIKTTEIYSHLRAEEVEGHSLRLICTYFY